MILNMIALTSLAGLRLLGALLAAGGSAESANKQKLVRGVVAIGGGSHSPRLCLHCYRGQQ